MEKKIAGILLGRKGSRGLPGKNIRNILGRPSLEYPLLAAKHCGLVTDLYVSTDSPEITAIAKDYGAVPVERPPELATHTALLEDAIHDSFKRVNAVKKYDYYLIILCNSCTILADNIKKAAEMLNADSSLSSVTTLAKYNMFSPVRARKIMPNHSVDSYISAETLEKETSLSCDRDQSIDCYFSDHSFTLTRSETLESLPNNPHPFKWMGKNIGMIEQAPGGGDIDFPWQVPLVEWWLKEHGFTETKTPY